MNMRRLQLTLCLLAALGLCAVPVRASEFDRKCSVTGGSAQRLSVVLTACGFTGSLNVKELTIKNPSASANSFYVGGSTVDASTGYEIEAGESKTYRSSGGTDVIVTTDKYLFVSSTQSGYFYARSQ
jgi:hypothetical protein